MYGTKLFILCYLIQYYPEAAECQGVHSYSFVVLSNESSNVIAMWSWIMYDAEDCGFYGTAY